MLAAERHLRVQQLLQAQISVRTVDIARALNVTEETVRRDFEKMEKDGLLMRTYGGAMRTDTLRREQDVRERAAQNVSAKQHIAVAAQGRIQPGQTIFFDSSTTVLQLAMNLVDMPVTVLTNSLHVVNALVQKPSIRVVLLGGDILASSLSCAGWAAIATLDAFHLDAAYISCRGIDLHRGTSEASEQQANLKRRVVERTETVCLLADDSKVGMASNYFFADNSQIDLWITNSPPPHLFQAAFSTPQQRIEVAG